MMETKIKEITLLIKSRMTRIDDSPAVVIHYDINGEAWQAYIQISDSWRSATSYELAVEAGSCEDAVNALHAKIVAMKKGELSRIIKNVYPKSRD